MEPRTKKTALPTIAGILSIVFGAFDLICVLGIIISAFFVAWEPGSTEDGVNVMAVLIAIGVAFLIFGTLAIIGGIFGVQRKGYILSLVGAIATLLPFNPLGIAPVVLMAMSKGEFETSSKPPFSDDSH
jgi:hypothetical protein